MLNKISNIFTKYIDPGDTLILGVSGGPDSTALLHVLLEFSNQTPCRIIVAHVNHGIRGRAADRDEKFVQKLTEEYHLTFEVKRVKLIGKSAIEERGRQIRRDFFEHLRKKYKARWILTAHTEDDQIETILFNFLRGSGPAGLAGMNLIDAYYLKPLLAIPKSEIFTYLTSRKLSFCRDRTNEDTRFRRNFIRKKILPLLERINFSFRKTLLRNRAIFAGIEAWMNFEARKFLKKYHTHDFLFPLKAYEQLPEALQNAVIQEAYRLVMKSFYNLSFVKIQEITRLVARRIGNKKILCGRGKGFLLRKGAVYAYYDSTVKPSLSRVRRVRGPFPSSAHV